MALTTVQQWSDAIQGQVIPISTSISLTPMGNATLASYWSGGTPATGSGAVPDNRSTGALQFVSPPLGKSAYLSKIKLSQSSEGTLLIYDRLWHNSGLVFTTSSDQSVNSLALTRHTDGKGVQIFIELYGTGVGYSAQNSTITVSYTNQDGVSGRTATLPSTMPPAEGWTRRVLPMMLDSGDYGVRSIQSFKSTVSLYGSTQPAFGLVLGYIHALIPAYSPQVMRTYNYLSLGSIEIDRQACLSLYKFSVTDVGGIYGTVRVAQG